MTNRRYRPPAGREGAITTLIGGNHYACHPRALERVIEERLPCSAADLRREIEHRTELVGYYDDYTFAELLLVLADFESGQMANEGLL